MRQISRRRLGFTLIESVTVLGIVCSLLLVVIYQFPTRVRQENAEKVFWEQLRNDWQQQVLVAGLTGKKHGANQSINFYQDTNTVTYMHQPDRTAWKVVKLPPTLHIDRGASVDIQANGHTSLRYVLFHSDLQPKLYN